MGSFRHHKVFKFFSSLKLAVVCLLSLATILGVATVLESLYGMRAAHVLVYGTFWFYTVLGVLGVNVFCAALSRYPWKKHQTGFVITHAGILVVLLGSLCTQRFGVDGNLPVIESNEDSRVILHALKLSIYDESRQREQAFPIQETAFRGQGDLMRLQFGDQQIVLKEFLPRSKSFRQIAASSIEGMGNPAVELVLTSSRFGEMEQTLFADKPDGWSELALGPAKLAFRKLETREEDQAFKKGALDFFEKPTSKSSKTSIGELVVFYSGQEHRISIEQAMGKWARVGSTSLQLQIDRYLPHAIVEKNELVSKSKEPINPAVQLKLKNASGREEKHTVFSNFPEFDTLHGSAQQKQRLGARFRFLASARNPQSMQSQAKLMLAQSSDGKQLFFHSIGASGEKRTAGEVHVGEAVPIGWMDTRLEVRSWFPHAVWKEEPVYVESVAGLKGNFVSAVRIESNPPMGLAGENWMFEGDVRSLNLNGKRYLLRFDREQLHLPFAIFLKKFSIGHDPGTEKAATYESDVEVRHPASSSADTPTTAKISMNDPLHYGGYTFYQASYQLREGAPPVSVFSVNYDPGRWIKYLGSLLLCLGIGLMFYMNPHYWGIVFGSLKSTSTKSRKAKK